MMSETDNAMQGVPDEVADASLMHEFVAQMVGAPRSAVTAAAAELRARKIIEYGRGTVIIKSTRRLRKSVCDCVDAGVV